MLKGRSALVTGSVQGIGLATARALAAQGCNVMLNGFADAATVERARSGLESEFGIAARYHGADLSKPPEIEQLVATAVAAFGTVDILVNNAVVRTAAPVEDFPPERWDMALDVNLSAPFHLMRLTLPGMRQRGWGRIVNVSSGFGLLGTPARIDYVTTKTGLIGMTRAIAVETAGTAITCNAVCPGATLTPRQEGKVDIMMARDNIDRAEAMRRLMENMAIARFISPESVAAVIAFLCSEAARDISGVALPVDGGFVAGAMLRDPGWQGVTNS